MKAPRTLPFFLGGFLGPLGTAVMVPMVPELREAFDASTEEVNLGYVTYLLPFAVLLVVSGTIGERYGRRRVLTITYIGFAAASLMCAFAPSVEVFWVARGFQGIANAFITPLLIAGLAEISPAGKLGRSVGIYSSVQALGSAFGPFIGGVAADTDWRLAFVFVAVTSVALIPFVPPGEPRPSTELPRIRPLLTKRMTWFGTAVMFAAAGPLGASVLIGIKARDELDVSGSDAGTILLLGSLLAMLLGPIWGRTLDTLGPRRTGAGAAAIVSVLTALLAWASTTTSLTATWLLLGSLSPLVVITFQSLGAVAVPENRAGGLSMILAYRFLGHGIGPIIFVPMWIAAPTAAFVVAASLGIVTIVGFLTMSDAEL